MIFYRSEVPPVEDFALLFETTGWNQEYKATPVELEHMLANSWQVVTAYDDGQLVGVGRIVSDRVLHAMVYDLIVLPAYQGRGIGGQILQRLVQFCLDNNIRDIQLFCARGKRGFYEKRGFIARSEDGPGMQYRRP